MEYVENKMVDITPEVSVYGTYKRLSYTPWYAISEFVDNSTQSYFDHRVELLNVYDDENEENCLVIDVNYDEEYNTLTIVDNANGMEYEELVRAVTLDKPPANTRGRCEFGMGLKTAACWFGSQWSIETTKLGSEKQYSVTVDVDILVKDKDNIIRVDTINASARNHYTKITINRLYKPLKGRTLGKIKDLLGSIYREDLRSGEIAIRWNGENVSFEEHPILIEENEDGSNIEWKKNLSFSVYCDYLRRDLHVEGWIGIRDPGSPKRAGLVLLRRGRTILGGPEENYRPREIFGQVNSFRYQRLVGEIRMDDWPVTQAKDSFDWTNGLEEDFLLKLKELSKEYIDKAENYRSTAKTISAATMRVASESTRKVFSNREFSKAIEQEIKFPEPAKAIEIQQKDNKKLKEASKGPMTYKLEMSDKEWIFNLHWQNTISDAHWMSVDFPQDNTIEIYLNMSHPFFSKYGNERRHIELIEKFVMSLALAEKLARATQSNGCLEPGDFRNYMNRVLRYGGRFGAEND